MRAWTLLGGTAVLVSLIACGQGTPTAPRAVEQPASPSPPARPTSIATLALTKGSIVSVTPTAGRIAFELTETSSRSAAVIHAVYVANDAGQIRVTNESCWVTPIRVEAGGTQDAFLREVPDPNDPLYGSCSPYYNLGPTSQVRVTVAFVDALGALGTVTASIPTK